MKARAKRTPGTWLRLQGLLAGALFVAVPGVGLAVTFMLAPAILGFIIETQPGRPRTQAMAMLGLAGASPSLRALLSSDLSIHAGLSLLAEPRHILAPWILSASGWLFSEIAEGVARIYLAMQAKAAIATMRADQAALDDEWGDGLAARDRRA